MKKGIGLRKIVVSILLTAAILVLPLEGVLQKTAGAASFVNGFPLPSGKVYSATVLHKYSGGSKHKSYLYTWGQLKKSKYDPNCVVDIAASKGTPIYAVAAGKIVRNKYTSGGGNQVVIKHDDGTYSYYGHMKAKCKIAKGSRVKAGQTIGKVGKTGSATGYHLHFEWSGHDPYCMYYSWGLLKTKKNSGASKHPHTHGLSIVSNTSLLVLSERVPSYRLKPTVSPKNMKITWSSSDTSKVRVDSAGTVSIAPVTGKLFNYEPARVYTVTGKISNGRKTASVSVPVRIQWNAFVMTEQQTEASLNNNDSDAGTSSSPAVSTPAPTPKPTAAPTPKPTPKPTPTPAPVNTWTGYVIGTDGTLAINSKPASGNMIGKIPEGKSVTVYPDKTSGKWYYVKYGTTSGYSHSNYITKTKPATKSGVVKGTDGSLNIRAGASTSSTIRGTVKEGKTVTVFTGRTSGSWYWIYYNGIAGYASKNYIK